MTLLLFLLVQRVRTSTNQTCKVYGIDLVFGAQFLHPSLRAADSERGMTPELKPVAVGSSPTNPQRDVARVASVLAVNRPEPLDESVGDPSTVRFSLDRKGKDRNTKRQLKIERGSSPQLC